MIDADTEKTWLICNQFCFLRIPAGNTRRPKVKIILNPLAKVTHFEEIRNELKAQKEQLDAFKEDLKILFKHHSIAPRDILDTAQQLGNAAFDQSDVRRCREFLKKYDLRKRI